MYLVLHKTNKYLQVKLNVSDVPHKVKKFLKKIFLGKLVFHKVCITQGNYDTPCIISLRYPNGVLIVHLPQKGDKMKELLYYDYTKLIGRIKECYNTQKNFSTIIGIGRVPLSMRLNGRLQFTQTEIERIITALDLKISDIPEYFFCKLCANKTA